MKKQTLPSLVKLSFFIACCLSPSVAFAQAVELPALVSGDELESMKGSTVNRNSSVGGSSSLTVGSSTTFGASVNTNSSPGSFGSAKSTLKLNSIGVDPDGSNGLDNSCPTGGCLRSSIGGENSTLTGSITNIRATDAVAIDDVSLTTGENTYATGDVNFTGISGENNLVLDPASIFESETSTSADENSNSESESSIDTSTKVSSAAASATIDTSTNADIKSSSFITTFQQAF